MTRRIAARILALATLVGLLAQALLVDNLLGVNAPILTAALLLAAWSVRPVDRSVDPLDAWLPAGAFIVSAGIAVRADPGLLVLDGFTACVLLGASMAAIAGFAVTRRSIAMIVELGFLVFGWAGIGILKVVAALSRTPRAGEPSADAIAPEGALVRRLPPWAAPVARGLLIALPIVLVFTSLFAAADAVFGRLVGVLFDWRFDLGEAPLRLSVTFLIGWVVAGLLAVATGRAIEVPELATSPRPQSLGAAAAGLPAPAHADGLPFRLGAIEAATVLVVVDGLFAVFVILQLAYLFGGLDTLAATGLPYAQYARSGFFELVRVAFLAGLLLTAVHAVAARRTRVLVGSGVVLAALTAVVLASALLRLRIYQDAYGWTELRFYVLASILWLAIGIGLAAVLLIRDRMRWLVHGLAMAAVAVLVGANIVGPSRLIAEQNVNRVLDPTLVPADGRSGLDLGYAAGLGDDAIPALVRVLPALAPADRSSLELALRERRDELAVDGSNGWPSWNLGREQAREALRSIGR